MKILTLWQPWASLLVCGIKGFETRSWATEYRGPLSIHAAKRPVVDAEVEAIYAALRRSSDQHALRKQLSEPLPLGQILAIANLTNCLQMIDSTIFDPCEVSFDPWIDIEAQTPLERAVGNWQHGRYAWEFNGVLKLIHPIDFRGKQGLRDLPIESVELIENTNGFSKGTK